MLSLGQLLVPTLIVLFNCLSSEAQNEEKIDCSKTIWGGPAGKHNYLKPIDRASNLSAADNFCKAIILIILKIPNNLLILIVGLIV